ncbi:MAG TPA: hypothetical protein ENH99_01570 [Candidatus Pacearchaeota archaeon]|uniref:Uncharacterized protein n=1 Tax=marine sediment metagenome TaxID=412755 RepID=A0A0F8WPQ6_9ZZZZ|nr:hypothetical protein [Candidatus Pacearchaeota archaeon]
MVTDEEFLKEHPGLSDAVWDNFPIFRKLIHETQLDKQKVKEAFRCCATIWDYDKALKELGLE